MSFEMNIGQRNFISMLDRIFKKTALKEEGYCDCIELSGNHITLNNITHFFEDNLYHYFTYNEYGQFSIDCIDQPIEKPSDVYSGRRSRHHISFDLKNLKQISFSAKSDMNEINPNTMDYYNELFVFELRD